MKSGRGPHSGSRARVPSTPLGQMPPGDRLSLYYAVTDARSGISPRRALQAEMGYPGASPRSFSKAGSGAAISAAALRQWPLAASRRMK